MLKSVSSITNAIGALNFKGTWDANANSPALASSVGTKGDYYVVGTAGTTNLNGISNWGVGDLATFNGSVWQRVEGGADLNGVNLSVSGTSTLSGLTASTALALNASKEIVSVTNTGTGDNVLATTPTLVGDVTLSTGNLVIGTSGKGIDFSADPSAPGMTSELLDDYEEGTWTPVVADASSGGNTGSFSGSATYTKIGRQVTVRMYISGINTTGMTAGNTFFVRGLPYASSNTAQGNFYTYRVGRDAATASSCVNMSGGSFFNFALFTTNSATADKTILVSDIVSGTSEIQVNITYFV
jgi:hypothetical protein